MNQKTDISALRVNYTKNELLEEEVLANPLAQFELWFEEAVAGEVLEPNAMIVSTIVNNRPTGRVILLKGVDKEGFVFYTNYASHKGKQVEENPFVSLTFFWDKLQRQVRVEGKIEKVSEKESDEYFWSRPRGSQIGAWVSNQSETIADRAILAQKAIEFEAKFENTAIIPRPPHWGGYRVIPDAIEFWQGRPNRLHDRLLFSKAENNDWKIERLSP